MKGLLPPSENSIAVNNNNNSNTRALNSNICKILLEYKYCEVRVLWAPVKNLLSMSYRIPTRATTSMMTIMIQLHGMTKSSATPMALAVPVRLLCPPTISSVASVWLSTPK